MGHSWEDPKIVARFAEGLKEAAEERGMTRPKPSKSRPRPAPKAPQYPALDAPEEAWDEWARAHCKTELVSMAAHRKLLNACAAAVARVIPEFPELEMDPYGSLVLRVPFVPPLPESEES